MDSFHPASRCHCHWAPNKSGLPARSTRIIFCSSKTSHRAHSTGTGRAGREPNNKATSYHVVNRNRLARHPWCIPWSQPSSRILPVNDLYLRAPCPVFQVSRGPADKGNRIIAHGVHRRNDCTPVELNERCALWVKRRTDATSANSRSGALAGCISLFSPIPGECCFP